METTQVPWWSIASTIVAALATGTLAVFAAVQIRDQRAQRKEREGAAGARIAATGFLVRRQIRSWLGEGEGSPSYLETWINAQKAGMLTTHLNAAESRFVEMLARAPDAAPTVSASVRTAAVLFFDGASRLNEFVNTPQPKGRKIADWVDLRDIAWRDFRDCVRTLEDHVGIDVILKEAITLDAKRRAEMSPMVALKSQLADGLARLQKKK